MALKTVTDNQGREICPDNMTQALNYTNGVLTSIVCTDNGGTWTQTLTYTGGVLTGLSQWVRS